MGFTVHGETEQKDTSKLSLGGRSAFTLIELLVVISIIALLLSILLPTLSTVKEKARRIICSTNVKGLLNSIFVYSHDYNDSMPIFAPRNAPSIQTGWTCAARESVLYFGIPVGLGLLYPDYNSDGHMYYCPSGAKIESYGEGRISGEMFNMDDELEDRNICSSYYLRGDLTEHYPNEDYNESAEFAEFRHEKILINHPNWIVLTDSGTYWAPEWYQLTREHERTENRINHPVGKFGAPGYFSNGWADGHVAGYKVKNPNEGWPADGGWPTPVAGTNAARNAVGMVRMEKGDW